MDTRVTKKLFAGAAGAMALVLLSGCGGGGGGEGPSSGGAPVAETFRNPREVVSRSGELRVDLEVAMATVQVDGKAVTTTVHNGEYVPRRCYGSSRATRWRFA